MTTTPDPESHGAIATARERTAQAYATARDKAGAALDSAREHGAAALDKAHAALGSAREHGAAALDRANAALDTARERTADIARRTAGGVQDHPVAALVGGFALGALVAALLPRARCNKEDQDAA